MDPKDKSERMKHAFAVMAGGALGRALMFLVSDGYAWLGVLAGFALGYLCYDLREVRREVPRAWSTAMRGAGATLRFVCTKRPLVHTGLACGTMCAYTFVTHAEATGAPSPHWFLEGVLYCMGGVLFIVLLPLVADHGASLVGLRRFGYDTLLFMIDNASPYRDRDDNDIPLTYARLWLWVALGLVVLPFKGLHALCIDLPRALWRFSIDLVRRIHSSDRLFCGLYASISATISLYALHGRNATLDEMLGITAATALIAYAVLHAGWKITAALLKDGEKTT